MQRAGLNTFTAQNGDAKGSTYRKAKAQRYGRRFDSAHLHQFPSVISWGRLFNRCGRVLVVYHGDSRKSYRLGGVYAGIWGLDENTKEHKDRRKNICR